MIIILTTQVIDHPKVPKIEQMLSTATAAENILLALHAKNYAGIWRTGKFAFNKKIAEYLNLTSDHEVIGYLYVGTPAGTNKKIPQLDVDKFVTHWNE
jgi:nitroreductase